MQTAKRLAKPISIKGAIIMTAYPYRGYTVEQNVYGRDEYTVQYDGDDFYFTDINEAFKFIDEMRDREDYEAERAYEMRAAFGEGQTIVDVITGKRYFT